MAAALEDAGAERDRKRRLVQPILDHSSFQMSADDINKLFLPATDAEKYAASRLGVDPVVIKAASMATWRRSFDDEGDASVPDELEPRSRQARRGLVTRGMLGSLRGLIAFVHGDDEREECVAEEAQ